MCRKAKWFNSNGVIALGGGKAFRWDYFIPKWKYGGTVRNATCFVCLQVTEIWIKINTLDCGKTQLGMKADPKTMLKIRPWNQLLRANNQPWPTLAQVWNNCSISTNTLDLQTFFAAVRSATTGKTVFETVAVKRSCFIPQLHAVPVARLQSSWL